MVRNLKLEIRNVTKSFKGRVAVSNFSMELHSGECLGLIGPNGAGKSTLIKIIADIISSSEGEVLLNGKNVSKMKREIGYLPQYPNFFPWMTAKETLMFMGQLSGLKKAELTKSISNILIKVGLDGTEDLKVSTFSGGMKQRLGIAQALLHKPSLIIMDEPVSALDPIGRREVLNLIENIKKDTTVLLSTHILSDVEEICDRFVIIKDGMKIEDTTIRELLKRNSKSKLSLEITLKDFEWINVAKNLSYVKDIEVTGNKVKVEVRNLEKNKILLLKHALDYNVDIIKFQLYNDTLEDMFLKMVVEK
jgi:ABC-2 type transport system ATP-binding protein